MHRRILLFAVVAALLFSLAGCAGKTASPRSGDLGAAQEIVDQATETMRSLFEGERQAQLDSLLQRAKGVMVIPSMGSVSFIFSVGGGNALMMARTDDGWSGPVFLSKGTGGFGYQAGISRVSGVIVYMHEDDVRYVLETGALLQGQAAVTLLDSDYEASRTPEFHESGDVVFVGDTTGLYAGIAMNAGGLSDRLRLNAAYHGTEIGDPLPILFEAGAVPDGARPLRDLLDMAVKRGEAAEADAAQKQKDGTEVPSN